MGSLRFRVDGSVRATALSPDGKTAAALVVQQGMTTLSLWEGATGRLLYRGRAHPGSGWALAFSPDGRQLATVGGDNEMRLWDVPAGRLARVCRGDEGDRFFYVCFSPQGKRVAAAGCEVGCVWEREGGKRLSRSEREEGHLTLAFTPDGKDLAPVGLDRAAVLWQAAGESLRRDAITCVTVSSDGKTVACGDQLGGVWLWEAATGKPIRHDRRAERAINALAFSPDGKVLAAGNGGDIDLYEPVAGKRFASCRGHHQEVTSLCFAGDGKQLLSGSEDGTLRQWDAQTGKRLGPEVGHGSEVRALAFSPDGRSLVSGGHDGTVRLWDIPTGRPLGEQREHGADVTAVSFAPDNKRLASAGGTLGAVRVWEVTPGRQLRPAWVQRFQGLEAVFSPDGKTVAAAAGPGGDITLWDAQRGTERSRWRGHAGGSSGLSYAPDGKTLGSVGNDQTLRLWDAATGRQLQAHPLPDQSMAQRIRSCPDGRTWAYPEPLPFVDLWDAATGKRLHRLRGGQAYSFSPDGLLLATDLNKGAPVLYEVPTGKEVLSWRGHGDREVRAVVFSPNGRLLASGAEDGTILLWDLDLVLHGAGPLPARQPDEKLEHLWDDLAGNNLRLAYQAIGLMAAAPKQSIPFLRQRLRPVRVDRQQLKRLLAELDDDSFAVRDRARRQLVELGDAIEADLRQALAEGPPLEVRLHLQRLLAQATGNVRPLRALAALERAGTPAARDLVRELAQGAEGARLTQSARAALQRLDGRASASPPGRQP
jgi:WD40 repeat protein